MTDDGQAADLHPDAARIAVRVQIEGRVQGVWFRGWTVEQAQALALSGWVRNRADGTVEAVFAGPADAVRTMIERCREGPIIARVTGLKETQIADQGFLGFAQRATK